MFKRVLIKLSGESLAGDESFGFEDETINRIVNEIIKVKKQGSKVSLVVGGGNFWRGRSADSKMNRAKADAIGMTATIMNALYLAESIRINGEKAIVMTPFVYGGITTLYNMDLANSYLDNGYILIFAGGLGHPYFSTDTIASVRAVELNCDCILYAKNIDGIYDSDPRTNKNAIKFDTITYKEIIEKNLQAIDISAMNLCNEQKIYSIAFDLNQENSILIATKNDDEIFKIGTKILFD